MLNKFQVEIEVIFQDLMILYDILQLQRDITWLINICFAHYSLRESHTFKLLFDCVTKLFFCICPRHIDQIMFCQMLYMQYFERDTIVESFTLFFL